MEPSTKMEEKKLSAAEVLHLVDLVKDRPVIWDHRHIDYRNNEKKAEAWTTIEAAMKILGCNQSSEFFSWCCHLVSCRGNDAKTLEEHQGLPAFAGHRLGCRLVELRSLEGARLSDAACR